MCADRANVIDADHWWLTDAAWTARRERIMDGLAWSTSERIAAALSVDTDEVIELLPRRDAGLCFEYARGGWDLVLIGSKGDRAALLFDVPTREMASRVAEVSEANIRAQGIRVRRFWS